MAKRFIVSHTCPQMLSLGWHAGLMSSRHAEAILVIIITPTHMRDLLVHNAICTVIGLHSVTQNSVSLQSPACDLGMARHTC